MHSFEHEGSDAELMRFVALVREATKAIGDVADLVADAGLGDVTAYLDSIRCSSLEIANVIDAIDAVAGRRETHDGR